MGGQARMVSGRKRGQDDPASGRAPNGGTHPWENLRDPLQPRCLCLASKRRRRFDRKGGAERGDQTEREYQEVSAAAPDRDRGTGAALASNRCGGMRVNVSTGETWWCDIAPNGDPACAKAR